MTPLYVYLLAYVLVSFALGVVWHMVLFKEYYNKLAIYTNIQKPRFAFGLSSMIIQGIVFGYVYPLVPDPLVFALGLWILLVSFAVFAEVAKQQTTSVLGFVGIQVAFCLVQTVLVSLVFWLV